MYKRRDSLIQCLKVFGWRCRVPLSYCHRTLTRCFSRDPRTPQHNIWDMTHIYLNQNSSYLIMLWIKITDLQHEWIFPQQTPSTLWKCCYNQSKWYEMHHMLIGLKSIHNWVFGFGCHNLGVDITNLYFFNAYLINIKFQQPNFSKKLIDGWHHELIVDTSKWWIVVLLGIDGFIEEVCVDI